MIINYEYLKVTRLTYNCAHLRLTKESQIVKFGEKGGKYSEKEKLFVAKEKTKGEGKGKNTRPSMGHMGSTGWYLMVLGQYRAVLVDGTGSVEGGTWLVLGGTRSVCSYSGLYTALLCQKKTILVGTWWTSAQCSRCQLKVA